MYSYGSPHMAAQKQDDQHERTFSSYVRIQVVVLKTYLGRWTIGRSGERGSGISVLPARYDDDDDIYIYIYTLGGSRIPLQRCSWGILLPQPSGLQGFKYVVYNYINSLWTRDSACQEKLGSHCSFSWSVRFLGSHRWYWHYILLVNTVESVVDNL